MNKAIISKRQHIDENQRRLESYRVRVSIVSKAKVYETDKEIADAVKIIPRDSVSVKRYRSYSFSAQ